MDQQDYTFKISFLGDPEDAERAGRELKADLEELEGVELAQVEVDPEPNTRSMAAVSADLLVSLVGVATAYRTAANVRSIVASPKVARIIHHFIDRNKDSEIELTLHDGTTVRLKNGAEASEMIENALRTSMVPQDDQEKS